jgi:hypothetical protein
MEVGMKEDGGPAFPIDAFGESRLDPSWGMSLRDWFAGQTLACMGTWNFTQTDSDRKDMALRCYKMADAMLAERTKE